MARKALCVGINDYPPHSITRQNIDLKGCVNDAKKWWSILTEHYDFARADAQLMLDGEATKAKMLACLKDLLAGATAEDRLVYTFSGHGTYKKKEVDGQIGYDQTQCPYDWESNLLFDNELRELFLNLPAGIHLTVISDSCHSGSVTRQGKEEMANPREYIWGAEWANDPLVPLDGIQRSRHIPPVLLGNEELTDVEFEVINRSEGKSGKPATATLLDMAESKMNDILISGCSEMELSKDVRFKPGYYGAMTFYATKAIEKRGYSITHKELHKTMRKWLRKFKFTQTPQLEGKDANKDRLIFA